MRKTILSFLLVVLLLLGNSGLSLAQETDGSQLYNYDITQDEFDEYNAAVQSCDTPSLECLVRYTTRFIAMEWVNDIQGTSNMKGLGPTSNAGSPGVVGGVFTAISGMYAYRPANTGRYVADVMDSAGFATPAYAQGLGFASLDPILGLWKMFRNVAYFFFIIIFIVIGFMIMFRAKIGSQAVVTAQQAIPSVIISLVLVTFSYAIAGFMIDLMYLLMFLMVGLFDGLSANSGNELVESTDLINFNIMNLTGFLFWNSLGENGDNIALSRTFLEAAGVGNLLSGIGGFLGGLTLTIVVTIAALIGCVRLFFELLKSYAAIVLGVVLAPLALMMGAIPGQNVFMPWLKGIIGNLLAFPVVLLLIIMFIEFTEGGASTVTDAGSTGGFMPPFLIGAGQSGIIGPLMGLAIILAMPEIVKKVKDSTGASDGGFAAMVAGAAWGRAKEAWGGKMPLGLNARNIAGTGALAATSLAATVPGAIIGGSIAKSRGQSFASGARRGALTGLVAPAGIRAGLPLAGDAMKALRTELGQLAAAETIGSVMRNVKKADSTQSQAQQTAFGQEQKDTGGVVPQKEGTTSTRKKGGSLTGGNI